MQLAYTGELSAREAKGHVTLPVDVPHSITELEIVLWHSDGLDGDLTHLLTLSLFDPCGFRGAGHRMGIPRDGGREHHVVIGLDHATPGYLPGPILPGQWVVVIDAHRITSAGLCAYRLAVSARVGAAHEGRVSGRDDPAHDSEARDGGERTVSTGATRPRRAQSRRVTGWYRGDLHAHTWHSDGAWTEHELVAWAREQCLDFVALTDHNTVSGLPGLDALRSADLRILAGMELTTFQGHALALGVREWVDWRTVPGVSSRTITDIARQVDASGGLFVIAHPMAVGDPVCTGCSWTYSEMMPGRARAVEVWNGGAWSAGDSRNAQALARYYGWLNDGHRLVATSGTDAHQSFPPGEPLGFNVVRARSLTETDVLDALCRGHLYLSAGPHVELSAGGRAGQRAMMGDAIPPGLVEVCALWRDVQPGWEARLVVNGRTRRTWAAGRPGRHAMECVFERGQWFTLEIRGAAGDLVALTNPIFVVGDTWRTIGP